MSSFDDAKQTLENDPGYRIYLIIKNTSLDWQVSAGGSITTTATVDAPRGPVQVHARITEANGRFKAEMRASRLPAAFQEAKEYASLDEAKSGVQDALGHLASMLVGIAGG